MVTTNELLAQQLLTLSSERDASPIVRGLAGFLGARSLKGVEQERREQLNAQREALAAALGGGIDPAAMEAIPIQGLQQALLARLKPQDPVALKEGERLVAPTTGETIAEGMANPLTEQKILTEEAQRKKFNLESKKLEKEIEGGLKDPAKIFTQARDLRKEFTGLSGEFIKQRDAYGRIQASAVDPSPAGDLALIFNYMKLLDPGSVVREGEFATASNSAGVPTIIRNMYNKVISGERLAPEQRKDFVDRSGKIYNTASKQQKSLSDQYSNLAIQAGLPPEEVAIDLGLVPVEIPSSQVPIQQPSTNLSDLTPEQLNELWRSADGD